MQICSSCACSYFTQMPHSSDGLKCWIKNCKALCEKALCTFFICFHAFIVALLNWFFFPFHSWHPLDVYPKRKSLNQIIQLMEAGAPLPQTGTKLGHFQMLPLSGGSLSTSVEQIRLSSSRNHCWTWDTSTGWYFMFVCFRLWNFNICIFFLISLLCTQMYSTYRNEGCLAWNMIWKKMTIPKNVSCAINIFSNALLIQDLGWVSWCWLSV